MLAAAENQFDIVDTILNHSKGKNMTCSEALKQACVCGNLLIVQRLVKEGAKINFLDHKGWSPLMYAAHDGHIDLVE